ncbi:MAG: hypothetical protein ACAH83_12040 [Alphaproteobacteria bacterium]
MSKTPTFDEIRRAIIASLSPDLLEKQYREQLSPDDPPETGHCAVASEAFYHIAGGRKAGFMPVVCGYAADGRGRMKFGAEKAEALKNPAWHKETHWWVRGPKDGRRGQGRIFDVTARQYPDPFPYEHGHNTGFMQPQQKPSKRAQTVIDRVTALLGGAALKRYRDANIAAYRAAPAKPQAFKR